MPELSMKKLSVAGVLALGLGLAGAGVAVASNTGWSALWVAPAADWPRLEWFAG
jgi:hypothetical protein